MKLTTTIDVQLGRGQNMREHYRVRANRVKAEREATAKALKGPFAYGALHDDDGARITLHRPWARVPLDSDNLSGAFKGVRDEIASFLGVDDRSERLHWIYTQSKQPKGTLPTVVIEVLPVADIDPQVKRVRELEAAIRDVLECVTYGGGVPVLVSEKPGESVWCRSGFDCGRSFALLREALLTSSK